MPSLIDGLVVMRMRIPANMGSENGTTLVELLVVMIAGLVVFGGIATMLMIAVSQSSRQTDRVSAFDNQRVAFDRMTRDLRQARSVVLEGQTVTAVVQSPEGDRQISWACGAGQCVRSDHTAGTSQTLIEGLVTGEPFSHASPGVLEISLEVRPDDAFKPVTLAGAVSFRNCSNQSVEAPAVLLNPC